VRLWLTPLGSDRLDTLAELHMEELTRLAPTMEALWRALADGGVRCAPPIRSGG
jgi:hypothetical protein